MLVLDTDLQDYQASSLGPADEVSIKKTAIFLFIGIFFFSVYFL